jgi:hypothetical protein
MAFLLFPIILTPKYEKLVLKESMGLFQKKLDAIEGKKRSENAKKIYCRDM